MTGTHIIANNDPQVVVNAALKFINEPVRKKDIRLVYSTTPIMVGLLPNGQANIMVFTSCLVLWECTKEEWESYLFTQKTLLVKS